MRLIADAVAPGLLLAQAIGRMGNWWNQELYGKPTDLPWGARDRPRRTGRPSTSRRDVPPDLPLRDALEPARWSACCCWVDRRFRIRPPALFALYVSLYTFGRFFEELLRIDPSHEFGGLRLNTWVSIVLFVLSTLFFVWWQFVRKHPERDEPRRRRRPEVEGPTMAIPRGRSR